MNQILLLTYFDRRIIKELNGIKTLIIPFNGIYLGRKIDEIEVHCEDSEKYNEEKVPTLMRIDVTSLAKNRIVGKLNSLKFYRGL